MLEKLKKIIEQLPKANTQILRQEMCAQIVSCLPMFYADLQTWELKYNKAVKSAVDELGLSKTEAVLTVESADWCYNYKNHKRMADIVEKALSTLQMYVPNTPIKS